MAAPAIGVLTGWAPLGLGQITATSALPIVHDRPPWPGVSAGYHKCVIAYYYDHNVALVKQTLSSSLRFVPTASAGGTPPWMSIVF